jgi:hypothetical protein
MILLNHAQFCKIIILVIIGLSCSILLNLAQSCSILLNLGQSWSILLNLAKHRSWLILQVLVRSSCSILHMIGLQVLTRSCKMLLLDLAKSTVLQDLVSTCILLRLSKMTCKSCFLGGYNQAGLALMNSADRCG